MAEWSRDTKWRQGHLLDIDAMISLGLCSRYDASKKAAIVATHDCDLAQLPESEPYIELIIGDTITEIDGNSSHAKSARKLHLQFDGEEPTLCQFEATKKISIAKNTLSDFLPKTKTFLDSQNRSIFQIWLASRYRRSAFPDEFERRLNESKLTKKISTTLAKCGAHVSGIFFDVDDGVEHIRNGEDDTYTLDIYILHPSDQDFEVAMKIANEAGAAIKIAFNEKLFKPHKKWKHIELRACDVLSDSTLTYAQFRLLKRWRLDHISLAAEPKQEVIAE